MKAWRTFGLALAFLGIVAWGIYTFSEQYFAPDTYKVIRVIDGDTIEVEQNDHVQSVRLTGIDAPENGECLFRASGLYLASLVLEKEVILEPDPINKDMDEYGRLLRYVYIDDEFVNEKMVETGFARYLGAFPFSFQDQFSALEQQARQDDLGLWGEC